MRRGFFAAALGVMLLALSGCRYFRPDQPEPPSDQSAFTPDYSSPDATLETIARAIEDKGVTIGGVAYAGAFADSTSASPVGYHHLFWPEDVAAWRQANNRPVPGDWGFALEQSFYTIFVRQRGDEYRMTWALDPPNPDDTGADLVTIHRHYLITTHTISGDRTSVQAIGFADLRLVRFPDGNWRIVRWEDRRDPNADSSDPDQVTLGRRRLNTQ